LSGSPGVSSTMSVSGCRIMTWIDEALGRPIAAQRASRSAAPPEVRHIARRRGGAGFMKSVRDDRGGHGWRRIQQRPGCGGSAARLPPLWTRHLNPHAGFMKRQEEACQSRCDTTLLISAVYSTQSFDRCGSSAALSPRNVLEGHHLHSQLLGRSSTNKNLFLEPFSGQGGVSGPWRESVRRQRDERGATSHQPSSRVERLAYRSGPGTPWRHAASRSVVVDPLARGPKRGARIRDSGGRELEERGAVVRVGNVRVQRDPVPVHFFRAPFKAGCVPPRRDVAVGGSVSGGRPCRHELRLHISRQPSGG